MEEAQSHPSVVFLNVASSYVPHTKVECHYNLLPGMKPSTRDWIGIFKGDASVRDYYTFVWGIMPDGGASEGTLHCSVQFQASYLPKPGPQQYHFRYVDHHGKVCGQSSPFQFSEPRPMDELVTLEEASDDGGGTDMLLVVPKAALLETQLEESRQEQGALLRESCRLKEEVQELRSRAADLEAALSSLRDEHTKLAAQYKELSNSYTEISKQRDTLSIQETGHLARIQELEGDIQRIGEKMLQRETELDRVKDTVKSLLREQEHIHHQLKEENAEKEQYQVKLQASKEESRSLASDLQEAKTRHGEKISQALMLQEDIQKLQQKLAAANRRTAQMESLCEQLRTTQDVLAASQQKVALLGEELASVASIRDRTISDLHKSRLEAAEVNIKLADMTLKWKEGKGQWWKEKAMLLQNVERVSSAFQARLADLRASSSLPDAWTDWRDSPDLMAGVQLSEESLLEAAGKEPALIPASLDLTGLPVPPPSPPPLPSPPPPKLPDGQDQTDGTGAKEKKDEYRGKFPKAAEVEFPFPNAPKEEKPLSELGRAHWLWDWQEARSQGASKGPLQSPVDRLKEEFDRAILDVEGPSCRPKEGGATRVTDPRGHRLEDSPPRPHPRRRRSPERHPWVPPLRSEQGSLGRASPPRPRRRNEEADQQHRGHTHQGPQRQEGPVQEDPPRFRGKFDGDPDQLAQFLDTAEIYIERYGHLYPFPRALVSAIAEGLEGEARRWSAALYKNRAPQLHDADEFLQLLRTRFEEAEEDPYAEDELRNLMQKGRPIREHIREFRRIVGTLPPLPERLLVYFFRTSLDKRIAQVTAYRDIPNRLSEWFQVAIKVERGLQANDMPKQLDSRERGQPDQGPPSRRGTAPPPSTQRPAPPQSPLKCYRCGGIGHMAAACGTPRREPDPPPRARPERGPKRATNTSRKTSQRVEGFAHLTETRGAPDDDNQSPEPYDSEEDGEDDPMPI